MSIRRLIPLLLLLPLVAIAGIVVPGTISFDGDFYTAYRAGEAPQGGSCPSGFTCGSVGTTTTCDVDDNAGTITVVADTAGDEVGRCIIYKTAATDQDIHVEFELQTPIIGDQSPFNECGPFVAEGTDISDYTSYVFYPIQAQPRLKTDVAGVGEQVQLSANTGLALPEFFLYQYDDSLTIEQGAEGNDGSTWAQIGDDVTKSLTFPVIYGVQCATDDDATGSATFDITDLVADGTIESLGGGGSPPTLLFDEDFTSTTWYNRAGWGAGANGGGPGGSPRSANGAIPGNTFTRVTGTNFGVSEIDGAYGQVVILQDERLGTNAGVWFTEIMGSFPGPGDDIYVRYYQAMGTDFDASGTSGKLPGFADDASGNCGSGGAPCDGTDGWTARSKHSSGVNQPCEGPSGNTVPLDNYVYHGDMPSQYGQNFDWVGANCGEVHVAVQGEWQCIEQKFRMNTGTNRNGHLMAWVDGTQVLNRTDVFWDETGNYPVVRVWWNVYHGGGPNVPAPQDMHIFYDEIAVSESQIGCPL